MSDLSKEEHEQLVESMNRAEEARNVLENKEYQRAFIEYRAMLYQSLTDTEDKEDDKRERIYRQLKSLSVVEDLLRERLENGVFAEEKLSTWQKFKKTLK